MCKIKLKYLGNVVRHKIDKSLQLCTNELNKLNLISHMSIISVTLINKNITFGHVAVMLIRITCPTGFNLPEIV